MRQLGITTVFDLRSDTEMLKYDTPIPSLPGINIVRTPVFHKEDYSPEEMARYILSYRPRHLWLRPLSRAPI
jgi:Tyrosine phosphatase family